MTSAPRPPVRIDATGITDQGKVRDRNEDHFVVATIGRTIEIRSTNIPSASFAERLGARIPAYLLAVADGVGGRAGGEVASEATVTTMLEYICEVSDCVHTLDSDQELELIAQLEQSVQTAHQRLIAAFGGPSDQVPATTLTLVLLLWPRAYHVHIGDSRAYVLRRQRLQRLTRDQTMGEYMLAAGLWTEERAARKGPATTLTSAVGGPDLLPAIGLVDLDVGDAVLLCTDGLTKHVSDERIGTVLLGGGTAHHMCEQLLGEALAAGGTDNVSVLIAASSPG